MIDPERLELADLWFPDCRETTDLRFGDLDVRQSRRTLGNDDWSVWVHPARLSGTRHITGKHARQHAKARKNPHHLVLPQGVRTPLEQIATLFEGLRQADETRRFL
jgi:hypothetical protein